MSEKLSYGSADSEQPTRAWHDLEGNLVIGPLKTEHNMHYAHINERGVLSFFASRADSAGLVPLSPDTASDGGDDGPR